MSKTILLGSFLFPQTYDTGHVLDVELKHTPDPANPVGSKLYKFSEFPDARIRHQLLYWVVQGFSSWCIPKASSSRKICYQSLKGFFIFLRETNSEVSNIEHITPYVLDEFEAWIKSRIKDTKKVNSLEKAWSCFNKIIRELRHRRPQLLHPEVVPRILARRVSGVGATRVFQSAQSTLTKEQIAALELVCRREVAHYRKLWLEGQKLMAEAEQQGWDGESLPDSYGGHLGHLLLYLKKQWVATGIRSMDKSGLRIRALYERKDIYFERFGLSSTAEFYRYLFPSHEDLVPFMLLVFIRSGGNSSDLLDLSRNCLVAPESKGSESSQLDSLLSALGNGKRYLYFYKKRTRKWQTRAYDAGNPSSPIVLIEQIIEMTHLTHSRARDLAQNKLWVFDAMPRGIIRVAREMAFAVQIRHLTKKYNLDKFTPRQLRNTFLNNVVVQTGSIFAAQIVAGHASPNTMHNNYLAGAGRVKLQETIAAVQVEMLAWVEKGILPEVRYNEAGKVGGTSALDAMLQTWLNMFLDHRLLFEGSHEKAARLIQLQVHLRESRHRLHPLRWAQGFEQLDALVNDIIRRFDKDSLSAAAGIAAIFATSIPLPPIE